MTADVRESRRRIAYYGGSFDPPHKGHLAIATALLEQFSLDKFVFIPAFHAPHKTRLKPTSAYDRYAMLCLATADDARIEVSRIEIEAPERPYSIETMSSIVSRDTDDEVFFVMGADSWMDILTWREWERLLLLTNHIVMTRPGYEIGIDHVGERVQERIVDTRAVTKLPEASEGRHIFITDAVNIDISATQIRTAIRNGGSDWVSDVPPEVANYIEKYQIY